MKSIFVQIASYRDPELIPTIKNLIETAHIPENLKICIAHQYAEEDEWDSQISRCRGIISHNPKMMN